NLVTDGVWNKDHIDFRLDGEPPSRGNYVHIEGGIDSMRDSTRLRRQPSPVHILDRNSHIGPGNEIIIRNRELDIRDLTILSRDQFVSLDGQISEDSTKILNLKVGKLDLSLLDLITDKSFKGSLTAEVDLSNYYR